MRLRNEMILEEHEVNCMRDLNGRHFGKVPMRRKTGSEVKATRKTLPLTVESAGMSTECHFKALIRL